ncbi:hypothetical protein [Caballeronia sp. GACF4]|uniref:hypothetical protein n=1 Tax=Caballeronia sp. GACF4 TaxID=2921763 RepID=UPI0020280372|nr:hypothetical protein [Caballeronia sp. GACF4]
MNNLTASSSTTARFAGRLAVTAACSTSAAFCWVEFVEMRDCLIHLRDPSACSLLAFATS